MMRKAALLTLLLLLAISAGAGAQDEDDLASSPIQAAEIWLTAAELDGGNATGVALRPEGLALDENATSGVYTSPVLDAPIPFNAVVPQWYAELPEGADLHLSLRTGRDDAWTGWIEVPVSDDMTLPEDEGITGDFLMVPVSEGTHRQLQVRLSLLQGDGDVAPRLEELRLNLMDTSAAPSVESLHPVQPQTVDEGYPKPAVVPRSQWCTDPRCNYTEDLSYYPVSHLILHHTVTSSSGDIVATLQAIWYYHAITREWGDIGYNYLVDPNGVLYEGHLGGDDVVGTHAAGANRGSMALSMIGNYTDIVPSAAMMGSAAALFAWKADQKDIDVYDSSRLPDVRWGLPNLMGHRDVYGTTACPGDSAFPLLPALRDEVARRIGFTSPYIYFDELEPATHFSRSAINWKDGPGGCGIDGHAFYTWSVTNPAESTNWGEWRPEIAAPGRYELSVYAPYCYTKAPDTEGATYRVTHAHGTSTVVVNQEANLGVWVPLGEYYFNSGTGGVLRLTDLTQTDEDAGVWFDAIRLRYLGPQVTLQAPPADSWLTNPTVTFRWSISNNAALSSQTLQVSRNEAFTDLVHDEWLPATVTEVSRTLSGVSEGRLFWRLLLRATNGETIPAPPTVFGLDLAAPTSHANGMYRFPDGRFLLTWGAEDAGSGVAGYNIAYRRDGTTQWLPWQNGVKVTSAFFVLPQAGQLYWFRVQAYDLAGNVETIHVDPGDASTGSALYLPHAGMLPVVFEE